MKEHTHGNNMQKQIASISYSGVSNCGVKKKNAHLAEKKIQYLSISNQ